MSPYFSSAVSLLLYAPPMEKTIGKMIAVAMSVRGKLALSEKCLHRKVEITAAAAMRSVFRFIMRTIVFRILILPVILFSSFKG